MLFEYKPGAFSNQPGFAPYTFARNAIAYEYTASGMLQQVAANVLRELHYWNGVRTTLIEPASTNWLLQSQALGTTWAPQTLTATNNVATAPDGTSTATSLVPTAVSGTSHQVSQAVTITAGEYVAFSCFLKANTYSGGRLQLVGASGNMVWWFDLAAGTVSLLSATTYTASGQVIVSLANGWYWIGCWGKTATDTSIGDYVTVYDTGPHAQSGTAFTGNGTSGLFAWGAQLERWGTAPAVAPPPTSYMPTGASTFSRPADNLTNRWLFQGMPLWLYAKFVDLGWSVSGNYNTGFQLEGGASGSACGRDLFLGSLGAAPGGHYGGWNTRTFPGGLENFVVFNTAVPYGATVELFSRLLASPGNPGGSIFELTRSQNGAITDGPTQSVGDGRFPLEDFADGTGGSTASLFITGGGNVLGPVGLVSLKIGADPLFKSTLALAAVA